MTSIPRNSSSSNRRADSETGPILAIDYGRRRIGLALSDELGLTARPLETIERSNRASDLRRLREVVRKHQVRRIVVGYPVRLDGAAGEMAAEAARFAGRIGKVLEVPVELVDERLSSWEAGQMLAEAARSGARIHGTGRSGHKGSQQRAGGHGTRGAPRSSSRFSRRRASDAVDQLAASIFLRDYLERRRESEGLGKNEASDSRH